MNLNYFKDQFEMVNECKDPEVKNFQLGILMNNLEQTYNIPAQNDENYNRANPNVMELYKSVSNARVF